MKAISRNQTSNIFEQYALKTRLSLLSFNCNANFTYTGRCVTQWEELTAISFNKKLKQLEAIITIKSANGYSWPLGTKASQEYVRFFIDWNECGKFENAGITSFSVHNDSSNSTSTQSPKQYLVRFNICPKKNIYQSKGKYMTLRVKAVLSWNLIPSPNPNDLPVFGNFVEKQIQIPVQ